MSIEAENSIKKAATIIRAGGLVAVPTETVYGLAADATNDEAVARIFEAKERPQFNPLIIHVADLAMAKSYAEFTPLAEKLATAFWPGPLTLVLPRQNNEVSLLVSAGLETIAIRMPAHDLAQSLIKAVARPLAAPSANRSGTISPTEPGHVRASLGDKVQMILDGGPSSIGLESTIIKVDGDNATLLRSGGLSRQEIETVIGKPLLQSTNAEKPQAPGMLASHYAPNAKMRLNAQSPKGGEAFLGFGDTSTNDKSALNLSETGDLREAAANLFRYLHTLDALAQKHGFETIAVAPIPNDGLGEAINDRLQRAAAPRDE